MLEAEMQAVLTLIPALRDHEITVHPLGGGLTNRNYLGKSTARVTCCESRERAPSCLASIASARSRVARPRRAELVGARGRRAEAGGDELAAVPDGRGATDAQLIEAVLCAGPVAGVAAWAVGCAAIFPDA